MIIGKLRHRIEIQALIIDTDSDGAQSEAWSNNFNTQLWADVQPLSGRELIEAGAVQSKVNTRIVIRYREGVLPNMRVLHKNNIYNIQAIIPDKETGNKYLTLICTSGVNEG
jgi:SPP1 family predicted phage head-tail adaptor